nr:U-scoloptoxin(19)-Sm1a [Helicoverpa armigera]
MGAVALKMLLKICYLLLVVNCFCSAVWDLNEVEIYGAGKAPFFEIPCMRIGGTCAQSFACPPGTKVGQRGLCPEQQRIGVECCRPHFSRHIKLHKKWLRRTLYMP